MVGRGRAAVAADEAHRGPAFTLALVVLEVADDQAEVLQVPVQGLEVGRGLKHHMSQSPDPCGLTNGALRAVRPGSFVAEVEHLRRLGRQGCELVGVGDDPHVDPTRVGQVHGEPADALRQLLDLRPGGVGETHHVARVRSREGRAQIPRPRSTAHDHARRAGVGPAQLELVGRPAHGGEPERVRKALRGDQVGLGELEPGQVEHLDDGVLRAAGVLATQRTLLAVQVAVGPVVTGHLLLLEKLLTISSRTNLSSVKSI